MCTRHPPVSSRHFGHPVTSHVSADWVKGLVLHFLQQIFQEVLVVTALMSVGTDKFLAQYSEMQNCEEIGQVNIRHLAAGKMKCMVCSQIVLLIIASYYLLIVHKISYSLFL